MQIGRWNHQSAGSGSHGGRSASGDSRPYSPRPAAGRGAGPARFGSRGPSRGGGSYGSRDGYGSRPSFGGRGGRRGGGGGGGFGSFGETEQESAKFMNKTVVTTEEPVFVAEHKFSDFDINPHLKKNIEAHNYVSPTPIKAKAIPHALLGQDVVGLAETGTGKTAAFLIPLIDKEMKQKGDRVLIMAPTRELAVQIEKELAGFAR